MDVPLDYIFYVYGLSFVLLAVVAWLRSGSGRDRLPWAWLAWFGCCTG
jgi:hypothetical protein